MAIRYEIRDRDGNLLSRHTTYDAAEKRYQRNLGWRCGICGNYRGGWGRCNHGTQNRVCNADHYNDRIVQIA
jgi:hypothetical protein